MELEFLVVVSSGTSTGPEVGWQYFCTAGEEELLESIAVIYVKTYMLECIQLILVNKISPTLNSIVLVII